jgi:hypothetical protein
MCDEEEKYHYDILWQQVERRHKLANGIPFWELEIIIGIFSTLKMNP